MSDKQFSYRYTAPTEEERKEIESIRNAFAENPPLEQLRSLNKKVQKRASLWGWIVSVIGFLVFGGGISVLLEMRSYGWGTAVVLLGVIGILGGRLTYDELLRHGQKKYGKQIAELAETLLKEEKKEEPPES